MKEGKIPGARRVSRKECRELSQLPWVLDEALSDDTFEARLLPDGRVLLYLRHAGEGTLYPSRASLEELLRRGKEMQRQADEERAKGFPDPCLTLLPPIDDFLRDVEAHAKSLGKVLRIPDEALDFTEASLDAVDVGLKRVRPAAKRATFPILTPLVAYVGEVLRRGCDGRWAKIPPTYQRAIPVYDPAELAAYREVARANRIAADQAKEDVKARRGSGAAQNEAFWNVIYQLAPFQPKPIRHDVYEQRIPGNENEPAIQARDGQLLRPFVMVYVPMVEPAKRIAVRHAVDVYLLPYRHAHQAGPPGTLVNPVVQPTPPRADSDPRETK
jgi:hypothetical protein